jgi:hypothetical protein
MKIVALRAVTAVLITGILLLSSTSLNKVDASSTDFLFHNDNQVAVVPESEGFIIYASQDGGVDCHDALTDDEKLLTTGSLSDEMHIISSPRLMGANGLTITLRSTQQLEGFPEAKAAFLKAAATWEALIASPITVIIDVDFGPTRFGQPYPSGVLGSTGSQALRLTGGYSTIRSRLISGASNDTERNLYNSLPADSLPTNMGSTTYISAPSPLFRALGQISADADPTNESYGAPPSIGFNSAFNYDFDPTNGVDAGKMDFDAVAVHEIGHALGFVSFASSQSGGIVNPTVWDIFRFAPGVNSLSFTTGQRVLSSGGQQVFFSGSAEIPLSTGVSGGDGNQTSHWKDDAFTGQHIGIMDPTIPGGRRFTISQNDLLTLDLLGYTLKTSSGGGGGGGGTVGNTPPSASQLVSNLSGNTLNLTGVASDPDADVRQAQITLFDSKGNAVAPSSTTDVNFGNTTQSNFTLRMNNMSVYPTAKQVKLIFIDSRGNQSNAVTGDFGQAEAGGATINKGSFDSSGPVLSLKGSGFVSGATEIEVNGTLVTPSKIKVKGEGAKVVITGSANLLNLRSGANRVRTRTNGKYSNSFVLNL